MKKHKYPIQSWSDPIVLAGLLKFLIARHAAPRSQSELVAGSLRRFHDTLVAYKKIKPFLTPEDAIGYLKMHGLGPTMTAKSRQRKAALAILNEDFGEDF